MTTSPVPSDTDRLAEIRARLDAASTSTTMDVHAGRATLRASVSGGDRGRFVGGMGDLVAATVGETGPLTVTVADDEDGQDATLALHARDDMEWLLKRVNLLEQAYGHAKEQITKYERRVIGWREQCSLATGERDAALVENRSLQARLTAAEERLRELATLQDRIPDDENGDWGAYWDGGYNAALMEVRDIANEVIGADADNAEPGNPKERADCPGCGKSVVIRKNGTLWHHRSTEPEYPGAVFRKLCEFSGKPARALGLGEGDEEARRG